MYSEPLSAVGSKKVKTVKIKRSRSVAGAAEFMRKMKQLSILDAVLAARGSLVSSPALTPLTLTTGAAPTGVTSPKKRKRKYPSWWRVFIKRNPMLFGRDRYPIAWEDAPPILRLEFYHWALTLMGQVYAFTLNLRNSVEDEAKDQLFHRQRQ